LKSTTRGEQREATRHRLVQCAVEVLLDGGYRALTTGEVQRRSGGSRGALLHHFPTRADLISAVVDEIVRRNERAVHAAATTVPDELRPVERAVRVLHTALSGPDFGAELELWTAARSDPDLRAALRNAEHRARRDLRRVIDELFGPQLVARSNYRLAAQLTTSLLQGIAVAAPLRPGQDRVDELVGAWSSVVEQLLNDSPQGKGS